MMNSLKSKKIDLVFDNPNYHNLENNRLTQIGKTVYFNGHTGIAFSERTQRYREEFNRSLERLDKKATSSALKQSKNR